MPGGGDCRDKAGSFKTMKGKLCADKDYMGTGYIFSLYIVIRSFFIVFR